MANPTFISPFLSARTAVGVSKETVYGTYVAPTRWVPVTAAKWEDEYKYYEDKAYRQLAAETYGHYQLVGSSLVQYDGPFYPDAPAYWVLGAFGQEAFTTAPANTTTTGTNSLGATTLTITSGTGFVNGAGILIDTGVGLQEGNLIISGGGTATLTLASPLRFTHTAGATVSGGYLHQFQMAPSATTPTVPSLSILDFYVENQRKAVGSVVEELSIKWAAETEATYAVKLTGQPSSTQSLPATSYTQIPPFTGWQTGNLIAGTAQPNLIDVEVSFKRKVAKLWGSNNQQGPVAIYATVLGVTGKIVFIMTSEGEYNHFTNADNPSLKIALSGPAPGQLGAATASGMLIQMTNTQFTKLPLERSKDYVEVQADFTADYNSTDAGPATVFLTNSYNAAL